MDIMNLLAQSRPGRLDAEPDADRRANDLALAMATPRDAPIPRPDPARRPGPRRPVRLIAIGASVAAVAATAGAVVAVDATGGPAAGTQSSATSSGQIKHAILTAVDGVWGDVFSVKMKETYSGTMAKYDDTQQNWSYPIRPQAGQVVRMRSVTEPVPSADKMDIEYIFTEQAGAKAALPTKTEMIYVQYQFRTWSDTYAQINTQSAAASLEELRQTIATGDFTKVGTTVIDGQRATEYIDRYKGGEQTVWINPTTNLPVRTLDDSSAAKIQTDYEFLPPTPANMANLTPPIPAGFTKTPTIQK
jgi:hypothetical protein